MFNLVYKSIVVECSTGVKGYVEQVHNPYLVRVGEYIVKVGYSDCTETLNDRLKQYISKIAETKY